MGKYATKDTWKECAIALDFSKKVPNFQLIKPLTIQQEVERFQAAGRNVKKMMGLGVYDFDDAREIDYSIEDPTRDPDYDLIDAATQNRDAILAIQAAQAAGTDTQSAGSNDESIDSKPNSKDKDQEPSVSEDDPS